MKYDSSLKSKLRRGCTSVQGIGLKDILKIRKMKNLPYEKPYMVNSKYIR